MMKQNCKSLKKHPRANCCVYCVSECGFTFYSRGRAIIDLSNDGWLNCYSVTAQQHIIWFLQEYAPAISYSEVKKCFIDRTSLNIYTGEII